MALQARERGAFETFHDLAWRAVQTGQPNDPDLMYLLARAQALSGRRRDALIVLRRLAEAGAVNDAATEPDLRRVRELPGWGEVQALAARLNTSAVAPAPVAAPDPPSSAPAAAPVLPSSAAPSVAAPSPAPPAASPARAPIPPTPPAAAPVALAAPVAPELPVTPPPAPRHALRIEPAAVEDAARFSTRAFVPSGLAYDAVSRRFLFGDVAGRRLFVVGEGTDRTTDLVRGESAGFEEVTALASDAQRGDLWLASSAPRGEAGAIHRLQLISGRMLATFAVARGDGALGLIDLAVSPSGLVVALDSGAPRVLVLRPGSTTLDPPLPLLVAAPVSVALDEPGRRAYVAHASGIVRIDLQARTAAPLDAEEGLELANIERLRRHGSALIAVQRQPDGSRGVVRLELNGAGTRVTGAALLDVPPDGDISFPTISGDALYYLTAVPPDATNESEPRTMEVVVRRIQLR